MSQNKQILNHLISVGRIDPITALKKFGCFRLAARIHDLKSLGHDIKPRLVKHKGSRFAVYFLNQIEGSAIRKNTGDYSKR